MCQKRTLSQSQDHDDDGIDTFRQGVSEVTWSTWCSRMELFGSKMCVCLMFAGFTRIGTYVEEYECFIFLKLFWFISNRLVKESIHVIWRLVFSSIIVKKHVNLFTAWGRMTSWKKKVLSPQSGLWEYHTDIAINMTIKLFCRLSIPTNDLSNDHDLVWVGCSKRSCV